VRVYTNAVLRFGHSYNIDVTIFSHISEEYQINEDVTYTQPAQIYPGDVVEVSKARSVSFETRSSGRLQDASRYSANPFDNESIETTKKVQVAVP